MRALPLLALLLVGTACVAFARPSTVLACSGGGDFDAVRDSDLIVAGRVTAWERSDRRLLPGGSYDAVKASFAVDEVYKGSGASFPGHFIDGGSLGAAAHYPENRWFGSAGACGIFDEDPTGRYFILGLRWDEGGFWRPSRLLVFYYGEPEGDWFNRVRSLLLADLGITAPVAGSGTKTSDGSRAWLLLSGVVLTAFGLGLQVGVKGRRR